MVDSLTEIGPYAIAVALSPVPLLAVVAVLGSRRGVANATAMLVGWIIGLSLTIAVTTWLLPSAVADDMVWLGWFNLVVGGAAILVAFALWRAKGVPDANQPPPWLAAIDELSLARSGGLGLVLAAANPKVISVTIAAVANLSADAGGGSAGRTGVFAMFVIIASGGIAALVIAAGLAADRTHRLQTRLRTLSATKGHYVLTPVFLILGFGLVGEAWRILG